MAASTQTAWKREPAPRLAVTTPPPLNPPPLAPHQAATPSRWSRSVLQRRHCRRRHTDGGNGSSPGGQGRRQLAPTAASWPPPPAVAAAPPPPTAASFGHSLESSVESALNDQLKSPSSRIPYPFEAYEAKDSRDPSSVPPGIAAAAGGSQQAAAAAGSLNYPVFASTI